MATKHGHGHFTGPTSSQDKRVATEVELGWKGSMDIGKRVNCGPMVDKVQGLSEGAPQNAEETAHQ